MVETPSDSTKTDTGKTAAGLAIIGSFAGGIAIGCATNGMTGWMSTIALFCFVCVMDASLGRIVRAIESKKT
ncbi:MAG: hypothetical protein JWL82_89 [Parcubacteria group bacterium]|nr:hypothetical protein [Parcubacteria group bacterium]